MSAAAPALAAPSESRWAPALDFLRLLLRKPMGAIGFAGVVFFLFLAFVAPLFVPLEDTVDVTQIYQPPALTHPLGTDNQGRDVLNQIVHGGRDILVVALLAALFSTLIAVFFGSLAAFRGGTVDALTVVITDIWLTMPRLPLLFVAASLLRVSSVPILAGIIAVFAWPGLLRQVRAQVLSLKEREYIEAARSLDLGLRHIVFSEILPNMRSYILIHFIFAMTAAIYSYAGLVFLGLVPASGSNWGVMFQYALQRGAIYFKDSFWYVMSPVAAIGLFQLSLVFLASALDEIFNPRLRSA